MLRYIKQNYLHFSRGIVYFYQICNDSALDSIDMVVTVYEGRRDDCNGCDDRSAVPLTVAAIDSSVIIVNAAAFVDRRCARGK